MVIRSEVVNFEYSFECWSSGLHVSIDVSNGAIN